MSISPGLLDMAEDFCTHLRRRQVEGSLATAKKTAELMRTLVTTQRHTDAQGLVDDVRAVGTKIQAAKPLEMAVGNMVRRTLHMIREESQQEVEEQQPHKPAVAEQEAAPGLLSKALRAPVLGIRNISLHNLLDQAPLDSAQFMEPPRDARGAAQLTPQQLFQQQHARQPIAQRQQAPEADEVSSINEASEAGGEREGPEGGRRKKGSVWRRRALVIEQLNELIDELDEIENNIAVQAVEHIHANEVILTFGMSNTTLLFLIEAAKKRNFQVIVAEGAPSYGGHQMARALAEAGVTTTAITDSAIFAMMARVNKVLVGAHALLANGGVMAAVGTHLVALAAKKHSVPFVVLVGLHKLSPLFPHDPSVIFNDFKSPADVIDFNVIAETMDPEDEQEAPYVHIPNPAFDYVPPELISLFVTDTGGYVPSYVYRLLADYGSSHSEISSGAAGWC
ncbi:hypothetical protein WJX72_004902 [[Myrmecia] bisecta]|uniref:Translation initiation factor eIF2B subunit beta n=1 Tax=[Myrmecia] bisecta TaxID=41462 RepID=A0AAW1R6M4_9CHLO